MLKYRPTVHILLLLLLTAAFYGTCPALAVEQYVRVVKCFDGDTVRLADGRTVRLAGIDTPETQKPDSPGQYYADEALALAKSLVLGQRVRLMSAGSGDGFERDSHNRSVAEIYLEDGRSLNEIMVDEGAAFVYPHQNLPESFTKRLLKAQTKAMDGKKGFWQRILAEDFAFKNYMGNRNSKRFFPMNCPDKDRVSTRNRVKFSSLKAAFAEGYSPARTCSFWPTTK